MSKRPNLATALEHNEEQYKPKEDAVKVETAPENPQDKQPPSRQKKRHISGYFTEEVHKQLRLIGFENDKSIQQMLTEALNNYFKIHDKPPIA